MMINKEEVDNAVLEFCIDIIKEPLMFFNEYDLHLLLVEKLYQFSSQENQPMNKNIKNKFLCLVKNDEVTTFIFWQQ